MHRPDFAKQYLPMAEFVERALVGRNTEELPMLIEAYHYFLMARDHEDANGAPGTTSRTFAYLGYQRLGMFDVGFIENSDDLLEKCMEVLK